MVLSSVLSGRSSDFYRGSYMTQGMARRTTMKSAIGATGVLAREVPALAGEATAADSSDQLTLWYGAPAADWERESLPIGSGALGVSVHGSHSVRGRREGAEGAGRPALRADHGRLRGCRATSDRAIVPWHARFQRCRQSPTLRVDSILRLGIACTRPRPLSDRRQPGSSQPLPYPGQMPGDQLVVEV
jgi:hypothetical protein